MQGASLSRLQTAAALGYAPLNIGIEIGSPLLLSLVIQHGPDSGAMCFLGSPDAAAVAERGE